MLLDQFLELESLFVLVVINSAGAVACGAPERVVTVVLVITVLNSEPLTVYVSVLLSA